MKFRELFESVEFEKMVTDGKLIAWAEGNYSKFREVFIDHITDYRGDSEYAEEDFEQWEGDIKYSWEHGGEVQRVVMLDSLEDMDLDPERWAGSTSWTTESLIHGHELVDYLRYNNEGNGNSTGTAYVVVAKNVPHNIHMGYINLPEEWRESEVNIVDLFKLKDIKLYKQDGHQFIHIGTIDFRAKKVIPL